MKSSLRTRVQECLQRGRDAGHVSPVIAYLPPESGHAADVYRARHGSPMPSGAAGGRPAVEAWSPREAAGLFRPHAAVAGVAVARLLEGRSAEVDWWLLRFDVSFLTVRGYLTDGRAFEDLVLYDEIFSAMCVCGAGGGFNSAAVSRVAGK